MRPEVIILILKPENDSKKKKLKPATSYEHRYKNPTAHKKNSTLQPSGVYSGKVSLVHV